MARRSLGFGLVELSVVAGIMSVVLVILYQASYVGAVSSKKGISRLDEMSKINRLFEQTKRVLRTARIVHEDQPKPFDFGYTVVYVDGIDPVTRIQKHARVKISRKAVPGQGIEIEFAKEGDRPITYAFPDSPGAPPARFRIYGARQELMITLLTQSRERHAVTVISPYFDAAISSLSAPEMVVVDVLGDGLGPAGLPAAQGASPVAPQATPGPSNTLLGSGQTAILPGPTRPSGRMDPPVRGSLVGPMSTQPGVAGPVRPPVASPIPMSAGTAATPGPGGGQVYGASPGARPESPPVAGASPALPALPGGRVVGPAAAGDADPTVKTGSNDRTRGPDPRQPVGSAGSTATLNARPPGLRPPSETNEPMTWAGSSPIDPRAGGDGITTAGTPSGGGRTPGGGTASGAQSTLPVPGTVPPSTRAGGARPGSTITGPGTGPLQPTSLPPPSVRIDQLRNQRPPRGNQAEVLQGSSVDSPFE